MGIISPVPPRFIVAVPARESALKTRACMADGPKLCIPHRSCQECA